MATPKDNTEVIRMLRDVKNSIWKCVTPIRQTQNNYNDYLLNLTYSANKSMANMSDIATRLNFSSLDDTHASDTTIGRSFENSESLKRKLMNTEVELQASQAKVKERESFISVLEPANKRICLNLENQLTNSRKQNEIDYQKIAELESKLSWTQKQLASVKDKIKDIDNEKKIEYDQQQYKLLSLQEKNSNLKIEVENVKSEKTESKLKVSMMHEEAEKSQDCIQSLRKRVREMAEKVALCNTYHAELKEAQDKIKALENKIEANKDAALIISSRQKDLKLLNELQKENRILKEEVAKYKENNVMLYQEKMWSLQEKLTHAEKKCMAIAELQVENEQLRTKINQWEELFDDKSSPYKSPTAFSRKLSQYQRNEAALTNKLSHLATHSETLEKQIKDKEDIIKSLTHKLEQAQQDISHQDSALKRSQRKILFLSKEKDHCRKLIDSYLSEATLSGIALNAAQISHLEELNEEYKAALEKCDKEIEDLNKKLKNSTNINECAEDVKLKEENAGLRTKITELEKKIDEIKNKSLNKEASKEGSSSSNERIVHLRFNPVANANRSYLENFHKLQEENDQLKKRIKVLEEEGVAASDVTMKVQQKLKTEGADSTLQELKEKLASSERKLGFIIENARSKSTEFREAVYRLLGYRIDVPMAETYKLSHMYADSRDDFLLFKINSEGIQLVETEYSKQVSDRMETYLHQYDSFPAFLASLTMDLFTQQTFMLEQ
ncbi:mitotic spindle assembly checkpoint protein MAD1 [Caerostris extrusa]|uniref:Mitotic spindle assembly checkpoint protein MAD1 n=1 Tax=Caerostris extrusa TaxID=172846 RepID=A0AAV4VVR3_CAEEX|nr:mitotic spindle assembly checkpoint protein MAD1 [Caerostris extrusa]